MGNCWSRRIKYTDKTLEENNGNNTLSICRNGDCYYCVKYNVNTPEERSSNT